jgi:hypothetical protein
MLYVCYLVGTHLRAAKTVPENYPHAPVVRTYSRVLAPTSRRFGLNGAGP